MHEVIKNRVHFDSQRGIWVLEGFGGIPYSDGIEAENYVLGCIEKARDVSSGSDELPRMIRDWPSQYHLSNDRSQLLRAFRFRPGSSGLEVGCGCGAITRFLGETLGELHAVEGSLLRAQAAAARCRDLSRVSVIAAPFHELQFKRTYDVVVCVGVLEYSRSFIRAEDPIQRCLEYLRKLVSSSGALVLAIENQFGLKYFSGCSEDHTNVHFDGIEGYAAAGDSGPVTFGRQELQDRLEAAGFSNTRFYLTFPDYKLPQCLIDDRAATRAPVNLGGLARRMPARDYSQRPLSLFCDTLAWWEIGKNRNLSTFSPSFLVVAHPDADGCPISADWDAVLFATARDRMYRTQTAFYGLGSGAGRVCKSPVHPESSNGETLKIHWGEALFDEGTPLDVLLLKAAKHRGKPFELFLQHLKTWVASLHQFKVGQNAPDRGLPLPDCLLSGRSLDATPWNLCVCDDGQRYIDLEWEWPSELPLAYVVARGLVGLMVGNVPHLKALVDPARPTLEQWIDDWFTRLWPDLKVAWREPFLSLEAELMAKVNRSDAAGMAAAYTRMLAQPLVQASGAVRPETKTGSGKTKPDRRGAGRAPEASFRASIIIPVFNQAEHTRRCLRALAATTPDPLYELILVDNASTDGTGDFLKALDGDVKIITNDSNLGFAAACNQGAQAASGDYLIFLNNATEPHTGWLEELVTVADSTSRIGIVGGKVLFPDGTIQHAGVSMPPLRLYRGQPADFPPANKPRDFQAVTGACMLVRRKVFSEVKGFEEHSISGYEDVDLCLRVREAGYRVYYTPRSILTLHGGKGEGSQDDVDVNKGVLDERWGDRFQRDLEEYLAQDGFRQEGTQWVFHEALCRKTVSVVIVTYNSFDVIRNCIDSVQKYTSLPHEIIVVDNHSGDGTKDYLRRIENGRDVRVIVNEDNCGFSRAANQGIAASSGEHVVLLNPDTVVTKDWAWRMMLHFDEDTGAVGPVSNYVTGDQKYEFYIGETVSDGTNAHDLADRLYTRNKHRSLSTKLLIGFCVMVRRQVLDRVGMLDEDLFLGSDDLEYSLRLRNNGYKLLVATDTFIYHKGRASFDTVASDRTEQLGQEGQDRLFAKLEKIYGPGNVPSSSDLWDMNWFRPTQLRESVLTSIVILTYNQLGYTRRCLASIAKHTPQRHEIILVDNASTDGTVEFLQEYERDHQNASVISNRENRGFAGGNNQGIEKARGDFVLLLNNDVVVTEGWLERMLSCMHRYPDVGIVGPTSNYVSGPQLVPNITYGEDLDKMQALAAAIGRDNHGKTSPVLRLVGFCLLIRKEVLGLIGGLDEGFGSGNYEDDDLCLRSHIAGFRHLIAHDAFVHHYGSVSFSGNAINYNGSMQKNRALFEGKWRHLISFSGNAYQLRMDRASQVGELVKWGEEARERGQIGRAVRLFSRALTLDPGDPTALRNLEIMGKIRNPAPGVESCGLGAQGSESRLQSPGPDRSQPEEVSVVLVRDGRGAVRTSAEELEKACGLRCEIVPFDLPADGPGLMSFLGERWNTFRGRVVAVLSEGVVVPPGAVEKLLALMDEDVSVDVAVPSSNVGTGPQGVKPQYRNLTKELDRFSRKIAHHRRGSAVDVNLPESPCVLIRRGPVRFPETFRTEAGLMALSRDVRKAGGRVVCCQEAYVHVELRTLEDPEREREASAVRCLEAAEAAEANRDPDGAVESARKAVSFAPGWAQAHNYLGRYLYGKGDRAGARSAFEKALAADPDYAEAYSNLGVLQWETGELEAAVESFGRASEIEPDNADVLYNVGSVYLQMGEPDRAAIFFGRCMELRPGDEDTRAQVEALRTANEQAENTD